MSIKTYENVYLNVLEVFSFIFFLCLFYFSPDFKPNISIFVKNILYTVGQISVFATLKKSNW